MTSGQKVQSTRKASLKFSPLLIKARRQAYVDFLCENGKLREDATAVAPVPADETHS